MWLIKSSRSWCITTFAASAAARWTNGVNRSSSLLNNSSSSCKTSSSLKASNLSPPPQRLNLRRQREFQRLDLPCLLRAQRTLPYAIAEKPLIIAASPPKIIVLLVLFRTLSFEHLLISRQSTEDSPGPSTASSVGRLKAPVTPGPVEGLRSKQSSSNQSRNSKRLWNPRDQAPAGKDPP